MLSGTGSPAPIAALTLDLDDTLWPILPVMERCERVLHDFLAEHAPPVAQRYPQSAMRALRDRVAEEHPELAHDYSALRRLSLERAFLHSELHAPHLVERAYRLFYSTRNEVEPFADVGRALPALAARHPILALTNGTADLGNIGLKPHFQGTVFAREVGWPKPDARIFAHACTVLSLPPEQVLHIGDDADLDVVGAARAGLRTAWINRRRQPWPYPDGPRPDFIVHDLAELDHRLAALQPLPARHCDA